MSNATAESKPRRRSPRDFALFIREGVWALDFATLPRARALLYRQFQILILVVKGFIDDGILLRASALTFTTLLSLVPLFAFAFAVVKGLGGPNLQKVILDRITPSNINVAKNILEYVNNTNVTSLGVVGVLGLFLTILGMLGNIERAFNKIWDIRRERPFLRKVADYISVLVVLPILLLAGMTLTAGLQSQTVLKTVSEHLAMSGAFDLLLVISAKAFTLSMMVGTFTFLYLFFPNTRVKFVSALAGGMLAGILWQFAQWGYVKFQFGVSKYNAIYGAFAQVPLLLAWLYFGWTIVLLGAEYACIHQSVSFHSIGLLSGNLTYAHREEFSLCLMLTIARRFAKGQPAPTIHDLARSEAMPPWLVEELLEALHTAGYIVAISGDVQAYVPARSLDKLHVVELLEKLRTSGKTGPGRYQLPSAITRLLERRRAALAEPLGGVTFSDLLADESPQK